MADDENEEGRGNVPSKGDFIPSNIEDDHVEPLPDQEEFWRPPVRFGSVPVEKEPLGWDRRKGFRKLLPSVYLPFQVVERVTFGHIELEPNRLFWGDNLYIMRQLPSESIDLIYIDPPFFSGRQYNVIFGDQNELRSFSDIWEGGMPGYLIWLNARLYEMKRLLKKTGSIYVHCDWHASHYIKVEMDKIFGHDNFRNEISWKRDAAGKGAKRISRQWPRVSDTILLYTKTLEWHFDQQYTAPTQLQIKEYRYQDLDGRKFKRTTLGDYSDKSIQEMEDKGLIYVSKTGRRYKKYYLDEAKVTVDSMWTDIFGFGVITSSRERIGYPTQKPEALLERIILASSKEGDLVADFFCGGGTTPAVAQRLGRSWIACDQSRVAVAITADRITRQVEERTGSLFSVPDFTVEHWGVYEARHLTKMPLDHFRAFVLKCFGAVEEEKQTGIHGMKGAIPVWVGEPDPKKAVTALEVQEFANAIRKTVRYRQDNLRDGIMLAWAFRPDALEAADRLRQLEQTDLNFIRLEQIRIDSPRFRVHVASLTTDHADLANFLTFVQPPRVEVGYKRIAHRTYKFDVSETMVMNSGSKIINVQWDFDYRERFSSTPGYSFIRSAKKEPQLQAQYEFPETGKVRIACKVQDDMGGEGLWSDEVEVS